MQIKRVINNHAICQQRLSDPNIKQILNKRNKRNIKWCFRLHNIFLWSIKIFWNIQIIFWEIIIITVTGISCLKILTEELIIKLKLNLLNLSWFVSLRFYTVFTKMIWLTTSSTFIRTCWNSSSVKLMVGRVMLNRF